MKTRFTAALSSKWSMQALDYIFTYPIFRSSRFAEACGISAPTAGRFIRALLKEGLLQTVRPGAGKRSAIYRFEPLMERVRV